MINIMDEGSFNLINSKLDKLIALLEVKDTSASNAAWLTGRQVAQMLNVSSRSLQTYRNAGRLAFSKTGNKIYYKQSEVMQFLERNHHQAFALNKRKI